MSAKLVPGTGTSMGVFNIDTLGFKLNSRLLRMIGMPQMLTVRVGLQGKARSISQG